MAGKPGQPPIEIISNTIFGRLTALKRIGCRIECRCECGAMVAVAASKLIRGLVKSCGCLQRDNRFKHGMTATPTYSNWDCMIQRCTNSNHKNYSYYGGSGVTICDRWMTFTNFLEDMGERPAPDMTVDRINGSKIYNKENCRWASKKVQSTNQKKRRNMTSKYKGVSFDKLTGKWRASIRIDGFNKRIGRYKTEEEAFDVYKKAAIEHFGAENCQW